MASNYAKSQTQTPTPTRACLCSPTNHPGSFRCNLHRNMKRSYGRAAVRISSSNRWELGVIAKANALKAFLLQIIKPSSHDLQRRRNFLHRPTRFCLMNANTHGVDFS
ncbi:hypothetical protein Ddye_021812 [Dipteronia dyeriana]|uniref:Uncharacterized protein n=1 Tax=Dipteronia dyeriana TaxID=168575 RepID=A0AAD9U2W7_9ROSI|nr:hypothetical protein Ddye_021812 [Dipteronia dyeriana]